jgi:hypothetical protein
MAEQLVEELCTSTFGRRWHAIIVGLGAKNAEFYGLARLDIAPPAFQNSSEIVLEQAVKRW